MTDASEKPSAPDAMPESNAATHEEGPADTAAALEEKPTDSATAPGEQPGNTAVLEEQPDDGAALPKAEPDEQATAPREEQGDPTAALETGAQGNSGASEQKPETARCPLCGIEVEAGALTCPRCKSRMDAHPSVPFALADTFDAWDSLGEEGASAQMALPFHTGIHTGPLPTVGATAALASDDRPPMAPQGFVAHEHDPWSDGAPVPAAEVAPTAEQATAPVPAGFEGSTPLAQASPAPTEAAFTEALAPCAQQPSVTQSEQGPNPPEAPAIEPSGFVALETKRSKRHIAGAVAAIVLMVAFLAGGAHLAAQANTLNQITDARVTADIRADALFAQGSASDDFVYPEPYQIDSVRLGTKEMVDGGIDAHATVRMSNGYFSESRDVLVHYRKGAEVEAGPEQASEDGWVHECAVVSSQVAPTRGIGHDDEQGIAEVSPALLDDGASCAVDVAFETEGSVWFARVSGTRTLTYRFVDNAWTRADAQESLGATSYQSLIGTYGQTSGAGRTSGEQGWGGIGSWFEGDDAPSAGKATQLAITWVDDASATFGGWLTCQASSGLLGTPKEATSAFSGQIADDGTLIVECDGQAGSIDFVATAAGQGSLSLEGHLYTEARKVLGGTRVDKAGFAATVSKQSDDAASMPQQSETVTERNAAAAEDSDEEEGREQPTRNYDQEQEPSDNGPEREGTGTFWDLWGLEDADNSGQDQGQGTEGATTNDPWSWWDGGSGTEKQNESERWTLEELFATP